MKLVCDVIVVGGGPAGSITALRLHRLGLDVRLLDAGPLGRAHVGEALTIGVHRQLEHLGVHNVLEVCGRRDFAYSEERWSSSSIRKRDAPPGACTVNRAMFDAALIRRCAAEGVPVSIDRRVKAITRGPDNAWIAAVSDQDQLAARFIVDATGRRGLLPKQRRRTGTRTIALFAYWQGPALPDWPRVCAGDMGWAWGAPILELGYNITCFVDQDDLPKGPADLRRTYLRCVADTGILSRADHSAEFSKVSACYASAWFDEESAGTNYIKVGESAQGLDPIASMGVQKAIQSGIWASIVVNSALNRPSSAETARTFYRSKIERSATAHARSIGEIYAARAGKRSQFWDRRSAANTPIKPEAPIATAIKPRAPSTPIARGRATSSSIPCIIGDFVENLEAIAIGPEKEPVAFVGGIPLFEIFRRVEEGGNLQDLRTWLAHRCRQDSIEPLLSWLFAHQIICSGGESVTP